MYYIYEIRNLITNKRYIGRTKQPEIRRKRHFSELKNNKHHCYKLQKSYNEYGEENFKFKILELIDDKLEAEKVEHNYINSDEELYNISKCSTCGDLISYHPNREEIVKKISIAIIKKWENMTPEEKEKISNKFKGSNNPNYNNRGEKNKLYGIPLTDDHKSKISKALIGRKLTDDVINKIREKNKGRTPWNKGKKLKPLSKKHRNKISKSLKGRKTYKIMKPVICEGYYFESLKCAAEFYNISSTGMKNRLNSNTNKFKNFYYFDRENDNKDKYIIHNENHKQNSKLNGIVKERLVFCEGEILTQKEAMKKYGLKSPSSIKNRCESKNEKWKEFYYLN